MSPYEDKPFRSDSEAAEPSEVHIRMAHPRVHPHVAPISGASGDAGDTPFVTSFCVAWEPSPIPPPHWIELLRKAPFGTQTIRARDLHWDGRAFSIELVNEADIEAFAVEMPDWVEFANAEFGRREHTAAEQALLEAKKRAEALEKRLRR